MNQVAVIVIQMTKQTMMKMMIARQGRRLIVRLVAVMVMVTGGLSLRVLRALKGLAMMRLRKSENLSASINVSSFKSKNTTPKQPTDF